MLLLHGLGSSKASFFDTAAALSRRYRVHAIDLPGFGGSSKPTLAPYGAPFAAQGRDRHDGRAGDRARPPGRQQHGRAGGDRGRPRAAGPRRRDRAAQPRRGVRASATGTGPCASPAPSSGCSRTRSAAAGSSARSGRCSPTATWSTRAWPTSSSTSSSASTARAAPAWRSSAAPARSTSSRRRSASTRGSSTLQPPALFVWASHDRLIPEAFRHHVERWLPSAEQVVLEGCGHVPRSRPRSAPTGCCERFFARVDPLGGARSHDRVTAASGAAARDGQRRGTPGLERSAGRWARRAPSRGRVPDRGPRRARSRLHPRDPPAPVAALAACTSAARCAGSATCPRTGPVLLVGNHSGGNLTPDTTVFTLAFSTYFGVERAFYQLAHNLVLSLSRPRVPAQVRDGRRVAGERPRARWRPAPRCSSTRAATTRSTAPRGSATASTSAAARASSGSRWSRTCRSCRSSPSAGRRRRCS